MYSLCWWKLLSRCVVRGCAYHLVVEYIIRISNMRNNLTCSLLSTNYSQNDDNITMREREGKSGTFYSSCMLAFLTALCTTNLQKGVEG